MSTRNAAGESARHDKARLRTLAARRIEALDSDVRQEADRRIREQLLAVAKGFRGRPLLAYRALRDEVDLGPLLHDLVEREEQVFLPRVDDLGVLRIVRWRPGEAMSPDGAGVLAPASGSLEDPSALGGLALVPGRAFDLHGGRVGRGKGFFDRMLGQDPGRWYSVGVAYECQVMDAVPRESHDRDVDGLVTETSVRVFGKSGDGQRGPSGTMKKSE